MKPDTSSLFVDHLEQILGTADLGPYGQYLLLLGASEEGCILVPDIEVAFYLLVTIFPPFVLKLLVNMYGDTFTTYCTLITYKLSHLGNMQYL